VTKFREDSEIEVPGIASDGYQGDYKLGC